MSLIPQQIVEVIEVVEHARKIGIEAPTRITFFSKNDEWIYTAVYDNRVCDECLSHEHDTFTGDMIRTLFPYWEVIDLERIDVHVHPNCRCYLERVLYYGDIGQETGEET